MNEFDLLLVVPESILAMLICLLLILAAWEKSKTAIIAITVGGIALSLLTLFLLLKTVDLKTAYAFGETFIFDPYAVFMKLVSGFLLLLAIPAVAARSMRSQIPLAECYALMLSSLLGIWVMASGTHLLTLYLGLELSSLSLYALAALDREMTRSSEAAMKYFVMGAIASGLLLYGVSFVYGITGSFDIADIAAYLASGESSLLLTVGLVLVLIAVLFKFGLAPLHMWVPDLYQGTPASVVAFLSSIPKIGILALFTRLFVSGFSDLVADWSLWCLYFGMASVAFGNLVAIAQTSIRRLLGYSAIAHMGYLFLGLSASQFGGLAAAHFYLTAYALMGITTFGVLSFITKQNGTEVDELHELAGLGKRQPMMSLLMMILMFSMAGVPPFVGFYAKFLVLQSLVNQGMIWAAVAAVFFAIIGAVYYLKVVKTLYFDKPSDTELSETCTSINYKLLGFNAALLLMLGFLPNFLLTTVYQVIESLDYFS